MNLQQKRPPITDYLALVNDRLHKLANTDRDVIEIIKIDDQLPCYRIDVT